MSETIINGIDVSKCEYINCCSKKAKCIILQDDILSDSQYCESEPDCYFKELKRLQEENKELKEENYQLQKSCQICENFIDGIPCKPLRDMDYDLQKVINQRDNYKQALEEIREIAKNACKGCTSECDCIIDDEPCKYYGFYKIRELIDEALNDRD